MLLFKSLPNLECYKQGITRTELPAGAFPNLSAGPRFHAEGSYRRPCWWQSSGCALRYLLSFRRPLSGSQQKERVCASTGWEGQLQAECCVCPKDDGEGRDGQGDQEGEGQQGYPGSCVKCLQLWHFPSYCVMGMR